MAPTYLSPGVYVEEVDGGSKPISGVSTAVAAFVGFTQKGPPNTPTLVTNWTQFVDSFGDFMEGSYMAHSVYGYFNNGGGNCYIVRIGAPAGTEDSEAPPAMAALPSRASSPADTLRISSIGPAEEAADVTIEVSDASPPEDGGDAPDDTFKITVRKGSTEEVFDNLTLRRGRGARNVETVVNDPQTGSKLIQVADLSAAGSMAERRPNAGTFNLAAPAAPTTEIAVAPNDFEGSAAERSGMGGLEAVDDVTMVVAPDVMAALNAGAIDLEGRPGRAHGHDNPLREDGRPGSHIRLPSGNEAAGDSELACERSQL